MCETCVPVCLSLSCGRELAELNSDAQVDRELGPKKEITATSCSLSYRHSTSGSTRLSQQPWLIPIPDPVTFQSVFCGLNLLTRKAGMGSVPSARCSRLQLGCHLHRGPVVRCDRLQQPETSTGCEAGKLW